MLVGGRNERFVDLAGDRLRRPVMLQSPLLPRSAIRLTPVAAIRPTVNRGATHAAQYNGAMVYTFDELAYLERDGFWTRADSRAMVVIDTSDGTPRDGLPISVIAGGVPTTITLTVGSWEVRFELAAGQKQEVTLPPSPDGVWALAIRSGAGFRPSEREPGSTDVRMLAAWVAIASQ